MKIGAIYKNKRNGKFYMLSAINSITMYGTFILLDDKYKYTAPIEDFELWLWLD